MSSVNTQFKSGWSGEKVCSSCNATFKANSGSQKTCINCRKCNWCLKFLKYSHQKFCNNSCAGKWKFENSLKVRNALLIGVYSPNRGISISRAQSGIPRPYFRGAKNPNWKGGTYGSERHRLMGTVEYKNWRKEVFSRDNFTCQMCNVRGGKLEADHIIPYSVDKTKILDISNGRTLCRTCHQKTDTWGFKVKKFQHLSEAGKKHK